MKNSCRPTRQKAGYAPAVKLTQGGIGWSLKLSQAKEILIIRDTLTNASS